MGSQDQCEAVDELRQPFTGQQEPERADYRTEIRQAEQTANRIRLQCGAIDLDSLVLDDPVIVVEVLSPSSERADTGEKLSDYFSVASIQMAGPGSG